MSRTQGYGLPATVRVAYGLLITSERTNSGSKRQFAIRPCAADIRARCSPWHIEAHASGRNPYTVRLVCGFGRHAAGFDMWPYFACTRNYTELIREAGRFWRHWEALANIAARFAC